MDVTQPEHHRGGRRWLGMIFLAMVLLKVAMLVFERTEVYGSLLTSHAGFGPALRVVGLIHALVLLGLLGAMVWSERRMPSDAA